MILAPPPVYISRTELEKSPYYYVSNLRMKDDSINGEELKAFFYCYTLPIYITSYFLV